MKLTAKQQKVTSEIEEYELEDYLNIFPVMKYVSKFDELEQNRTVYNALKIMKIEPRYAIGDAFNLGYQETCEKLGVEPFKH